MNARRATAMFREAIPDRRSVSFNWPSLNAAPPATASGADVEAFDALRRGARDDCGAGPAAVLRRAPRDTALDCADGRQRRCARRSRTPGVPRTRPGREDARARLDASRRAWGASARWALRAATAGVAAAGAAFRDVGLPPAIEELRRRRLSLPVNGVRADQLVPTFDEARGDRPHEAIDIMAPRGTPVVATEDGRIAKLFWSKAGGHTIYQFDPTDALCLLLRASRSLRGRPGRGSDRDARTDDWLRRIDGQCESRCPASALRDFSADAGEALVGWRRARSVSRAPLEHRRRHAVRTHLMPISFYPPDASDFPFVANESRLQRLDQRLESTSRSIRRSASRRPDLPAGAADGPENAAAGPAGRRRGAGNAAGRTRTDSRRGSAERAE